MSSSTTSPQAGTSVRGPLTRSQRLDRLPFTRKHGKLLGEQTPTEPKASTAPRIAARTVPRSSARHRRRPGPAS